MKTDKTACWYVYMVSCADRSLYTGVTTHIGRRLDEHNHDDRRGAKYTRARRPVTLVFSEQFDNRSDACRQEYRIKSLSRQEKERLIKHYYEIQNRSGR